MATLAKMLNVGPTFKNEKETVRTRYDFSKDAGATGALDIFTAKVDIIITAFYTVVKTAATSGGSATLKVGVSADDDLFLTTVQGAVANLTLGAALFPAVVEGTPNVLACPVKVPAGSKVLQTIGTAALTAGVVEYVMEYMAA